MHVFISCAPPAIGRMLGVRRGGAVERHCCHFPKSRAMPRADPQAWRLQAFSADPKLQFRSEPQREGYFLWKVSTTAVFLRRFASLTEMKRPVFASLLT